SLHRGDRLAGHAPVRRAGAGAHRRRGSGPGAGPGRRAVHRRVARLSRPARTDDAGGNRGRGEERARPPRGPRKAAADHRNGAAREAARGEDGAGQRGGTTRAPPLRARRLPAGGGPGAPDGAGDGGVRDPGGGPERGKDPPRMERPMSCDAGSPGLPGQAYGLPHTVDEARVVLVPVPFEATTSYGGGAGEGPGAAVRAPPTGARRVCRRGCGGPPRRGTSSISRPAAPTSTASPCSPRSPGSAPGTRKPSGSPRPPSRPGAPPPGTPPPPAAAAS